MLVRSAASVGLFLLSRTEDLFVELITHLTAQKCENKTKISSEKTLHISIDVIRQTPSTIGYNKAPSLREIVSS